MRLRIDIRPYRLPLRRPWRSAHGMVSERIGWLVVASAEGIDGFGDCAPLTEAGTETAANAQRRLDYWSDIGHVQIGVDAVARLLDALALNKNTATPAADCALECALLDLRARQRGLPLRRLLAADAVDRIAVNAAIGSAATLTAARITDAIAQGFRVLKVKVGMSSPDVELDRIRAAALKLPAGVALRLDANGAWDRESARRFVSGLDGLPIDCLEEPLAVPDDADLAALQAQASFAIALDESLSRRPRLMDAGQDLIGLPVRRLVLKPGVIGGLRPTLRLAKRARAAGLGVVFTGLVESAAGLWTTAQVAAASGSPLAHGLATADWLAGDLGQAPRPLDGCIELPEGAGSGFTPAGPRA